MPALPDRMPRLLEPASDLWWSWSPTAREVFRKLDYRLWQMTAHNPVRMLRVILREHWNRAAGDAALLSLCDAAMEVSTVPATRKGPGGGAE